MPRPVLWEPGSGLSTRRAVSRGGLCSRAAMAADRSALVVAEFDRSLKIRDGRTGHARRRIDAAKVRIQRALAFQRDAGIVASADEEGIDVWHAATGVRVGPRFALHETVCLALAPDGRTLAAGDHEGMVRICDLAGGRLLQVFRAHSSPVWSLAFANDGRTLATAGEMDGIVRIWDPATGHRLAELDTLSGSGVLAGQPSPGRGGPGRRTADLGPGDAPAAAKGHGAAWRRNCSGLLARRAGCSLRRLRSDLVAPARCRAWAVTSFVVTTRRSPPGKRPRRSPGWCACFPGPRAPGSERAVFAKSKISCVRFRR